MSYWYNLGGTQTCITDGHLHRVTYTRCRIDTIWVEPKTAYQTVTYIEWHIPHVVLIQYGWNPNLHTRRSPTYSDIYQMSYWYNLGGTQTCIPDGHLHRVTYTRCRIDTIWVEPKPAYRTVTYIEWHIPDVVLIQLILLMISTWVLETCRDLE